MLNKMKEEQNIMSTITNEERLRYVDNHHLTINEHTIIKVEPNFLLNNPDDAEGYVNNTYTDIFLTLSDNDGNTFAKGQYEDLIKYINVHVAEHTRSKGKRNTGDSIAL